MTLLPPDLRNPNGTATRWDLLTLFDAVAALVKHDDLGVWRDHLRAELIKQLNGR